MRVIHLGAILAGLDQPAYQNFIQQVADMEPISVSKQHLVAGRRGDLEPDQVLVDCGDTILICC